MEPIQIIRVVGVRRGKRQPPPAMDVDDVFGTGGGFRQSYLLAGGSGVLDDGGGAHGVEGFEFGGGEERGASVDLEGVGDGEFFAEPGDAFGLGDVEVVDG